MTHLARRPWVPEFSEDYVQHIAASLDGDATSQIDDRIAALIDDNRRIHDRDCFNLNPATNVMNPRAEGRWRRGWAAVRRWAIPATSTRWGWRRSRRSR